MKIKKVWIICAIFLISIIMGNLKCLADNEETVTSDFEVAGTLSDSLIEEISYYYADYENQSLLISVGKYNLPSNLYEYRDYVRFRITYIKKADSKIEDNDIKECKVVNYKTGEIIEDLSDEKIVKLFNPVSEGNVIEKEWIDEIDLSNFTEGEFYKFTAKETSQFPKIKNDLNKNCIVYLKEKDKETYTQNIYVGKNISSGSPSFSFNEYEQGETFSVSYKIVENDELLKLISNNDIIYLDGYKNGEKLNYKFEKYIYNNTENNITIRVKNEISGVEILNEAITIEKNQIYGFDWMVNSAVIEKIDNKDDKENQSTEKVNDNTTEDTTKKVDKTTARTQLPKTGSSMIINIILIFGILSIMIFAMLNNKYKDIK